MSTFLFMLFLPSIYPYLSAEAGDASDAGEAGEAGDVGDIGDIGDDGNGGDASERGDVRDSGDAGDGGDAADTGDDVKAVGVIDASIECDADKMTVKWSKDMDFTNVHLLDGTCSVDKDSQEIEVPLGSCGTTATFNSSHVIYENTVKGTSVEQLDGSSPIVRGDTMEITVKCAYERTIGPTFHVAWEAQGKSTVTKRLRVEGEGSLAKALTLSIFKSSEFRQKDASFPVALSLNDDVYIEVAVEIPDDTLSLAVVAIQASESPSGEVVEGDMVHNIVGCIADRTFSYIDSGDPKKKRFTFKAFTFLDSEYPVYIRATVMLCEKDDTSCEYSCADGDRKKRTLKHKGDRPEEYYVFQGPFVATDPDQNLGVFAVSVTIWLVAGIGSSLQLLCNAFCFVYPTYKTLEVLESPQEEDGDDYIQWLSYWIVYNIFNILEYLIFFRIPLYNVFKCLVLVMCMVNRTTDYGTAVFYHDVVQPWLQKREDLSIPEILQFTAADLEEMSIKDKSSKTEVYELKRFDPNLCETDGTKGRWCDDGSITLKVFNALYNSGGFRNVFKAALESNPEEKYVVKRYNLDVKHHIINRGGDLSQHAKMDVQRTTGVASIYAGNFSRECGLQGSAELRYHPVYISLPEGKEPVFIERFIAPDLRFLKYICNEGQLSKGTPPEEQKICETFVHYTFEKSDGKHMVCDIQGWFPLLCDPEIATFKKSDKAIHSLGDHSNVAIKNFSETHECSNICQELGLTKLPVYNETVSGLSEKKENQEEQNEKEQLEQKEKEQQMKEQQEQLRLKAEEERLEREVQELKMRGPQHNLIEEEQENLEQLQRDKMKLEQEIQELNRKKKERMEQTRQERVEQELQRLERVLEGKEKKERERREKKERRKIKRQKAKRQCAIM